MITISLQDLRRQLESIADPEIPVITLADLGVLRSVDYDDTTQRVLVTITPTYSGCPAMQFIEDEIQRTLAAAGVDGEVRTVFQPAWTTDWITAEGRARLRGYGIAPPRPREVGVTISSRSVACPQCASTNTETISEFGSTACKALHRCLDCLEPFDHFKEL